IRTGGSLRSPNTFFVDVFACFPVMPAACPFSIPLFDYNLLGLTDLYIRGLRGPCEQFCFY
ncbi:hypothetical protein P8631_22970, partial [Guyparkeria sp. 1SP6A2]|nr:hypothetical protein [Guyparkeria sp. 1SP6A2]